MFALLKKNIFAISFITITIIIGVFEWYYVFNNWLTKAEVGELSYFLICLDFLHLLYMFTTLGQGVLLLLLLMLSRIYKMNEIFVKNIYYSLFFLIVFTLVIEFIYK
jgi:hypothetical protein